MNPQQKRRRELEKKWKQVKREVILRDNGTCVVCGKPAVTVNHILSRGAHKRLFLEKSNLCCLCAEHDTPSTNTKEFAKMLLRILKSRYGFEYDGEFNEVLNA